MSERDAYQKKLEAKLDEWRADIDKLKAKAAGAGAEAEVEINELLNDLRARRDQAEAKLDKLRHAGEGAWHDLKSGIELAFDEFERSVERARKRFE